MVKKETKKSKVVSIKKNSAKNSKIKKQTKAKTKVKGKSRIKKTVGITEETHDTQLVDMFKKGSIEAFEELVSRHESKVYNLAIKFTKNQEDAEEVLQDVWSTIFRKIESFKGESAFTSWMYRICVNASFMKLRKNNQQSAIHLEDLSRSVRQVYTNRESSYANKSDSMTLSREIKTAMNQAITELPEQYKRVFILRDVDGLSNEEVSNILKLTVPAVKSRLHRSRIMLRKKLNRFWNDYTGLVPMMRQSPVALKAGNQ